MKALLLAPLAALVVGILTAPSTPAYPCPPSTVPVGGSQGIPLRCVPALDSSGCYTDRYGAHEICPGQPRFCGPFGCTDGSPPPG